MWLAPAFLIYHLAGSTPLGRGVGLQTRNFDFFAAVCAQSSAAMRNPQQGRVYITDLPDKAVDLRQRDVDQQVCQG